MSDTVKLIIEIPKHLYDVIKNKECTNRNVITTAVENGIPLDNVKSKIADIETYERDGCWVMADVWKILNNIDKESETN